MGPQASLVLGKGSPCWLLEALRPRCQALPWATMLLFTGSLLPPPALLNFPNGSHPYYFTQFTFQREVFRLILLRYRRENCVCVWRGVRGREGAVYVGRGNRICPRSPTGNTSGWKVAESELSEPSQGRSFVLRNPQDMKQTRIQV